MDMGACCGGGWTIAIMGGGADSGGFIMQAASIPIAGSTASNFACR
jgi:hypothetical protein